MNNNTTPAEKVINAAGSASELARLLGVDKSWVGRWLKPVSELGTSGQVPRAHYKKILELSEIKGWNLTPSDLISF